MTTGPSSAAFPYMFWAHTEAAVSACCLSQSGMPAPDPALFARPELPDLGHPAAKALPALEARLAQRFGVDPHRVLVVPGASGAMLVCALRFFPGARVVTELPSYEPFRALPDRLARETRIVERRLAQGWRLPLDAVERELAGARPAHLFLSTPHNPTGAVLAADEIRTLAALAERAGGVLLSNEIYMEFAPAAERLHACHLARNALSIGSLTKAYGLGPLRIGWIVLGEGLEQEREHLLDMAYLAWVDPPTVALRAALSAMDALEALLAPLRRLERESRPLLQRWLSDCPLVEGSLGPWGLCAFPRVEGVDDTRSLQRHLAREHGVDVVPGEFFGRPGHLRVSYCAAPAALCEGLARVERGIASFRAGS